MAIRFWSLVLSVALGLSASFAPSHAGEPCCNVTAIDARTHVVTAREMRTGRTFQFKAADTKLLPSLRIGQAVHADFTTMKVSVNPDGATPCCAIVNLQRPATMPNR